MYFLGKEEQGSLKSNVDLEEDGTQTITWKLAALLPKPSPCPKAFTIAAKTRSQGKEMLWMKERGRRRSW